MLWKLDGLSVEVSALAFSPEGRRGAIGLGSGSSRLLLLDARTGKVVRDVAAHDRKITGVAFSPHGPRIASSSDDKTVRLFEAATCRPLLVFREHPGGVSGVVFTRTGRLASAGWHDSLIIRDATPLERRPLASLPGLARSAK